MKNKKLFLLTLLTIAGSQAYGMDKALEDISKQNQALAKQTGAYLKQLNMAATMVATSDDVMAKLKCHGDACAALATAREEQSKLYHQAAAATERVLAKHGIKHKPKSALPAPKGSRPTTAMTPRTTPRPRHGYVVAPWDK